MVDFQVQKHFVNSMNGKGDKWRGGWTPQYADNHNKIFGGKMNRWTQNPSPQRC